MAEYSQEQLQSALQKAVAAGDTEAIGHIQSMISPTQQQQEPVAQNQVTETGPWTAAGKSAVESAPGAVGGTLFSIPAALGTARMLAPVSPWAAAIGGAGAGLLSGSVGSAATEKVAKGLTDAFLSPQAKADLGYSPEQREYERTAFPQASKVGEFIPDVLSMGVPQKTLGKGIMNFQANKIWSDTSPAQRQAWKTASEWGLKLEPNQVREGAKATVVGNRENTRIINAKVAELTGDTSKPTHIDQNYLNSRFEALGSKYDSIYNDPSLGVASGKLGIPLEQNAQDSITRLFADQIPMPTQLKNRMVQGLQSIQQNGHIGGEDFRFIMSELKKVQRTTNDGNVKYAIGDAIDNINHSLANTNPELKAKLDQINPQYRALVTAQEARAKDVIDVNGNVDAFGLGKMLKSSPRDRNPLQEIGFIGEALGIGSHAKGTYPKNPNTQQGKNLLFGIPGYLADKAGKVGGMNLLEAFKRGGPALETTYSSVAGNKE